MDQEDTTPQLEESVQALDTLQQFLEGDEWYPQQVGDRAAFRVLFNGANGQFTCFADLRMDLAQFLFYALAPVKAPEESHMALAEFLTRANYGLRIGNFELDYSDGEIRYKSSLDFEAAELTPALIRNTIYPAVQTMDRYLPGIMSVIYGGRTPVEAILDIEGE